MITHVQIRNWRNYEELDLELLPGATFIVAANGIGKTSLVEAVRWAIFGLVNGGSSPHDAVRVGAPEAAVEVTIDLDRRGELRIRRTLARRASRTTQATVALNGIPIADNQIDTLLSEAFAANYQFLSRLLVPFGNREQAATKPDQIGLEQHLGRIYGVDNLRDAIEVLNVRLRENDKAIKAVKAAHAADPARMTDLRELVKTTRLLQQQREEELAAVDAEATLARNIENARERHSEWASQKNRRDLAIDTLAAAATTVFNRSIEPAALNVTISQREEELSNNLRDLQVEQGINQSRIETLEANRERLDTAHNDCPVCRRPLDEDTVAFAHTSTDEDITLLRQTNETLALDEARTLHDLKAIRELRSAAQQVPSLPPEPALLADAGVLAARGSEDLIDAARNARQKLIEASTDHRRAQEQLDAELTAASANQHLIALWTEAAHLEVAKSAAQATVTELLKGTIGPLANEITQRWTTLFPQRGEVRTTPSGTITRSLGEAELPFTAFSTGESTGAILLLRLLVVQMATSASFCWFDEPLEHLAPETRRDVANLLSRVTQTHGPLRQVVVTTYEDQLAQRLRDRDPDNVHLVYVRQAD